jgi:hypothetical protein
MRMNSLAMVTRVAAMAALMTSMTDGAAVESSAGRVVSVTGQVQATGLDGQTRAVRKNDMVSAGDTLSTNDGRAQIHFRDGGVIALKPRTQFRIDEYNYAGSEDGSERSFFSLLKGGFRAISGAIGHKNRDAYRVKTAVATIGIRGSAYEGDICNNDCENKENGLHETTDDGTINLSNRAGSLDVPAGKSAYVKDENTPPVLVEENGGGEPLDELGDNPLDDPNFRAGENPVDFTPPKIDPIPPPTPEIPPPSNGGGVITPPSGGPSTAPIP